MEAGGRAVFDHLRGWTNGARTIDGRRDQVGCKAEAGGDSAIGGDWAGGVGGAAEVTATTR